MSLVASFITPEISLLLGDARVTVGNEKRFDCCQKVFRLSESTLMGFVGDVRTAAEFLSTVILLHQMKGEAFCNHAFGIHELVLKFTLQHEEMMEAFRLADGSEPARTDFIFTGRLRPNVPLFQTFIFSIPGGRFELLTQNGFTLSGSGQNALGVRTDKLQEVISSFREWSAQHHDPDHFLAMSIAGHINSILTMNAARAAKKREPIDSSFGVILHGMYVDRNRVTPVEIRQMHSGKVFGIKKQAFEGDFDVRYVDGCFVLKTENGREITLVTPNLLMAQQDIFAANSPILDPHPAEPSRWTTIRELFQF